LEILRGKYRFGGAGEDGMILLKWIFEKYFVKMEWIKMALFGVQGRDRRF
jgi:hypothetical protein